MSGAALTADAVAGTATQIYDLHDGSLELVSVLPGGQPNPATSVVGFREESSRNHRSNVEHAVSADGSRIFWTSPNDFTHYGEIYVRVDGGTTLPVSAEAEELSSASKSMYWTSAADGSRTLFTTDAAIANVRDDDLYKFDVDRALAGEPATTLVAHGVSGVLGASDDLSRVYFVSSENLAPGAKQGGHNLFLDEEGETEFIAAVTKWDAGRDLGAGISLAAQNPEGRANRVTPDGRFAAFQASGRLTGYDNVDPVDGRMYEEVYRYDADSGDLSCVSCNPTGARPVGLPGVPIPYTAHPFDGPAAFFQTNELRVAAELPTWERDTHASQALSDDGQRVFFNSFEPLAPSDTNGVQDVYQWQAPGSGTCDTESPTYSAANGGCIDLISTGKSPQRSEFYDASADGESVFFSTNSSIDPRDEGLTDVYVARVGGGLAIPADEPACEGDACQDIPAAPTDQTPASASFRGRGDPAPRSRCRTSSRRAAKLSRQTRRLRRAAARSRSPRQARRLRRRSARTAKRVKQLRKQARRCRRANGGAQR